MGADNSKSAEGTENNEVKNVKDTEYSVIRAQILQYDQTCVTIIGILLAASTAVYGLAIKKDAYVLLPILSIIWLVGFLYISEKRFWIRRSALYLRDVVEDKKIGLYWQSWLKENERDARSFRFIPFRLKEDEKNAVFLRFSPLRYEYFLLFVVNSTNLILILIKLCISKNIILIGISLLTLILTILLYFKVVKFYYNKSVKA